MSSITVSGVVEVTLAERRSVPKSPSKGSTGAEKSNTTYDFYEVPLHTWEYDTSAKAPYALTASVRHYPANFKDVFFDKQHFDGLSPPPHVKKYTFNTTNTIDEGRFVYMSGVMHAGIPVDGPGKLLIDAHRLDPFPGDISSESYADQFPPDAYLDAVITGVIVGTRTAIPHTTYVAQVIIVADEYVCGEKRTSRVIVVFDLSFPRFKNMREISANSAVQVTGIIVGVLDECLAVLANGYTLGIGSKASGVRDPLAVPKPVPVSPKRQRHSAAPHRVKAEPEEPVTHKLEELAPIASVSKLPDVHDSANEDIGTGIGDAAPEDVDIEGSPRKRQRQRH